uniref:Transmembrane protein n=1 Tax=Wuchereria bancrofti TaxID=6293 RepID=A0A1I8EQ18_WUCBA
DKQFLPLTKICIVNDYSLDQLKYRKQSGGDICQQCIALSSQTASCCFDFLKFTNRLRMLRRSFMKRNSSKRSETKQNESDVKIKTLSNNGKFSNSKIIRTGKIFHIFYFLSLVYFIKIFNLGKRKIILLKFKILDYIFSFFLFSYLLLLFVYLLVIIYYNCH